MMLSKEALELLIGHTAQHREAAINASDGSRLIWLYNDKERKYEAQGLAPLKRARGVSNVESLAAMVLEEARRRAPDDEAAAADRGDYMTVVFGVAGATFYLDDREGLNDFTYRRTLSPQWQTLMAAATGAVDHIRFVRTLQLLKPSIKDAARVLMAYRRIALDAGVTIDSAPILDQGASGFAYATRLQVRGKTMDADLPATITLELQYARGSAKSYTIEAEVNIEAVAKGAEGKLVPMFSLAIPDRAAVEELAVADELAWFREATKDLTRLHILESY